MKTKRLILSFICVGFISTILNTEATTIAIRNIPVLSGTGRTATVSKSTNDNYYTANFREDGVVNTFILWLYSKDVKALAPTIIATEGGGSVRQDYYPGQDSSAGKEVYLLYKDWNGNVAGYTCSGTVDVR